MPHTVALASPLSPNEVSGLPFGRYRATNTCSPEEPAFPATRILPSDWAATALVTLVCAPPNCTVPPPNAVSTPPPGLTSVTARLEG